MAQPYHPKTNQTTNQPTQNTQYLHALAYPPQWELRRDLAERYAGMGVVASAADLYEGLGMWDEVVECYKVLVRACVRLRAWVDGVGVYYGWVYVCIDTMPPPTFSPQTPNDQPPTTNPKNRAAPPAPRRWCVSSWACGRRRPCGRRWGT